MTKEDIKKALEFCTELELPCEECPYDNVRNCSDTLKLNARKLIIAQENEIEQLKEEKSNIRKETAKEFLGMLCDMGIDKETLECCRIFDVNGISLAKRICEKYGVVVENDNRRN